MGDGAQPNLGIWKTRLNFLSEMCLVNSKTVFICGALNGSNPKPSEELSFPGQDQARE